MIQKMFRGTFTRKVHLIVAALIATFQMSSASALEVVGGDYEVFPGGINLAVLYYQHAERKDLYANGTKVSDNFDLKSDIGIVRFVKPTALSERVVIDPQFLLPFGRLDGSGDAAVLGNTSGVGDLILGAPVKYLLDTVTRDAVTLGTYVFVPIGSYDKDRPLNLGEHRWKALFQLAYVKHFGSKWAIDVIGDVQFHGANRDFGPTSATLKQKPRYELQTHLRYNVTEAASVGVDYGYITGGETRIDGVDQDNKLRSQYVRLSGTYWFTKSLQGVLQIGRDFNVHNGPEERSRLNLRLAKVF